MRPSLKRGFTYIECLIVVGMVAVLLAIALPRFLRAQTHARQSEAITNLKSLHAALMTQQVKPLNIHVAPFDPPRGNRYSYHLDNYCSTTENRSGMNAVQHTSDVCVGADTFAHQNFPRTFYPRSVVSPTWGSRAVSNGMGASAGYFGSSEDPYGWDYLAYAAGDVESETSWDSGPYDGADTWFVSSSDGQVNRVCPATTTALFAPAGEPFLVYDDASCN